MDKKGGVGGDGVNYVDNETHGIFLFAIRSILKMRKWKGSASGNLCTSYSLMVS